MNIQGICRAGMALASLMCLLGAVAVSAQTAPSFPPPTYDFDPLLPGAQPPKSPLLAGYHYRSVRTYQISIPVLVPVSELQAILPPGFTALPSAEGATTATLSLGFFVDQRFERTAIGQSFGPVSALLVSTTVLNTNVSPARRELVFPSFEASGEIDALNASFGPGSAKLADVKVKIEQANGVSSFSFDISNPVSGFKISADVVGPSAINTRTVSDPVGLPFRTFNGRTANNAFWAASQSDTLAVPATPESVKVTSPGKRLRFPGGTVSMVGIGANLTFSWGGRADRLCLPCVIWRIPVIGSLTVVDELFNRHPFPRTQPRPSAQRRCQRVSGE
jgi:hypothetical protein